jgi:hypothetical protein
LEPEFGEWKWRKWRERIFGRRFCKLERQRGQLAGQRFEFGKLRQQLRFPPQLVRYRFWKLER